MLNDAEINRFRSTLLNERDQLRAEDSDAAEDRATVMLDQQSVGRLSRMDAIQRQAMAQATARRRQGRELRIEAALERIAQGEFGFCLECGEDIGTKRLALDPTLPNCVSCAKG